MVGFFKLLHHFFLKPSLWRPFLLSLFINLLIWLALWWKIPPSSEWLPLHYNIYFGIDWLGPWSYIFISPFLGLIIILLNACLVIWLQLKELFLSQLLIWTSVVIQLIIILHLLLLTIQYFS